MKKKQLLALFMAGTLGISSSFALAETYSITGTDYYHGCINLVTYDFEYEGNYFGVNDFLGGTSWYDSGEQVSLYADLLITNNDPDIDSDFISSGLTKYIKTSEICTIDDGDIANINICHVIGVTFTHKAYVNGTSVKEVTRTVY